MSNSLIQLLPFDALPEPALPAEPAGPSEDWLDGHAAGYAIEDFIPFTERVYFRMIELHNETLWPLQVPAVLLGLAAVLLTVTTGALAPWWWMVTIADYAGQSAQMGWISYLTFLALISISLGVLNLLPIPLLDGGHLMYYAIEIVKGTPVSERAMELGQRVGLALLLVMMAFAFYNDLNRLLTG